MLLLMPGRLMAILRQDPQRCKRLHLSPIMPLELGHQLLTPMQLHHLIGRHIAIGADPQVSKALLLDI